MSKSYAVYEVVTGEIKQVIMTPFESEVAAYPTRRPIVQRDRR